MTQPALVGTFPTTEISFTVLGKPVPQGAITPSVITRRDGSIVYRHGRPVVTARHSNDKDLQFWRRRCADEAQRAIERGAVRPIMDAPIVLTARFFFMRPKSAPRRVIRHTKRPDLGKCIRAVEDALTGVLYTDDSQIFAYGAGTQKVYTTEQPRIEVTVSYRLALRPPSRRRRSLAARGARHLPLIPTRNPRRHVTSPGIYRAVCSMYSAGYGEKKFWK